MSVWPFVMGAFVRVRRIVTFIYLLLGSNKTEIHTIRILRLRCPYYLKCLPQGLERHVVTLLTLRAPNKG